MYIYSGLIFYELENLKLTENSELKSHFFIMSFVVFTTCLKLAMTLKACELAQASIPISFMGTKVKYLGNSKSISFLIADHASASLESNPSTAICFHPTCVLTCRQSLTSRRETTGTSPLRISTMSRVKSEQIDNRLCLHTLDYKNVDT